jgi:alkylated DNA repair dioxygenase AlkB
MSVFADAAANQPLRWNMEAKAFQMQLPLSLSGAIDPDLEPVPGLFIFHDFITKEEEVIMLEQLDCSMEAQEWKSQRHTGSHKEKRWGVDHDLWSRDIRAPKHPFPSFMNEVLLPRLRQVVAMKGCIPNDANAIDYRRDLGHSLRAHVDDRKKHNEPIANLSLAGTCYMTYRNQNQQRNLAIAEMKILLPPRTLQVLTGKARYDFSHGIDNIDLLSERRVSLTMRETLDPAGVARY